MPRAEFLMHLLMRAKRAKAFLRVIARDINRAGLGLQGLRYWAGNLNKGGCVAGHNAV